MLDDPAIGKEFTFRDVPPLRSGTYQHGPGCCSCAAILLPGIGDGIASSGRLRTELQVLVEGSIRRRGFDPNLCPVGIEFFSQNRREACMDPLPRFAVLGNNRHNVIRSDPHKGVGCQSVLSNSSLRLGESAPALREPEAEDQTGSARGANLEKLA